MISTNGLKNKNTVITGATSGIGLQTVLAFARRGAFVIGVGRSPERIDRARKTIEACVPEAQVRFLIADLSSLEQVRRLANEIYAEIRRRDAHGLDVLVNNAGIFSESYVKTPEGLELTMAVNHFAPFLLTHELSGLLTAAPLGRVITVSSASHYRTFLEIDHLNAPRVYFGLWAYKVSKLANVLFTREFNRRMEHTRVRAFAVDPGLVNTEIGAKRSRGLVRWFWQIRAKSGVQPEVPVETILRLTDDDLVFETDDVYWYLGRPQPPGRQARRADLAAALWDFSCQTCGIKWNGKDVDDGTEII